MTAIFKASVLFLAASFFYQPSVQSDDGQSSSQAAKPIVVVLAKMHGKLSYTVESKLVNDPLRGLGEQVERKGENWPVIIFFPANATFDEQNELALIANKTGFRNVRSFLHNPRSPFMQELKWDSSTPYSADPPSK